MTKPRVKIKHCKRRGEWAEMRFMAMAAENGLEVTKPFGEMARYDFIVEHEGKFARVQVKSTMYRNGRGYACTMRGWRGPYGRNEFDYVALYLILEDVWYIVPTKNIRGKWTSPPVRPSNIRSVLVVKNDAAAVGGALASYLFSLRCQRGVCPRTGPPPGNAGASGLSL